MPAALRVNTPSVVGEIIDGEAVIMDLASGHYFSTDGTGAVVWSGIEQGLPRPALVTMLANRYDADAQALTAAVDTFVAELLERKLVVESDATEFSVSPQVTGDSSARTAFVTPVLNAYADMEDLLLLDPIHDVDATGWPTARPADASTP